MLASFRRQKKKKRPIPQCLSHVLFACFSSPPPFLHYLPGHADMTKYEWATNQHRDTMASHVGHYDQLSYYAVAQNESVGRVRAQMLEKMLEPCGPPPTKKKQQES
jgi:splicing factor 3B subunit 5